MQARADALSLTAERVGEPQCRAAAARSVQGRCAVSEFDECEIRREAYPLYDHGGAVALTSA